VRQQGGEPFTLLPLQDIEDVAEFYSYDDPFADSADTPFEVSNRSTWFVHRDRFGVLSLVLVHDTAGEMQPSGGTLELRVDGLHPGTSTVVQDDPPSAGGDVYDLALGTFSWGWGACCSDGVALSPMPMDLCVTLTPLRWSGLDGIDVLSAVPNGDPLRLPFALGDPLELCQTVCE